MIGTVFRSSRGKRIFSLFVILSISLSMLCINLTLATARNEYESSLNINYLTTIAVSFKNNPDDAAHMDKVLQEKYDTELLNVLYLTDTDDGTTLIGWYGYKQTSWFPHMYGRFFTTDEYEQKEHVAYINEDEYMALVNNNQTEIEIDHVPYKMIGAGSFRPFNFHFAISDESDQTILQSENTEDYTFRAIPSSVFTEKYLPELVLVQFDNLSYKELEKKCGEIKELYPNATVTMPKRNSDTYLLTEKLKRSTAGIFLALCVSISTVGIMLEWVAMNKKAIYTYLLCGATKKSVVFSIYAEWILYYLVAMIFALILQKILTSVLSLIGAHLLPYWNDLAVEFILFFLLTWVATYKKVKRSTELETE